jgi:uncharacterized membrane protein
MAEPPRRLILRRALQFALGVASVPRVLSAAAAQSCVDPQSESLRASLHYAGVSTVANQSCSGCGFFTRDSGKAGCGSCVIMSGPVDETGHCDSWSARS